MYVSFICVFFHMVAHLFTGPPIIIIHPTSQLITVDMSVTLNCHGTGRGSITYQWETNNIKRGQWIKISTINSKRLVVRNLKQLQKYRCIVSNEVASTISNIATITVLSKDIKINCMYII